MGSNRRETNGQYSPDGKRIAYSSNRSGNYDLWVADADGDNATQITNLGAGLTGAPRWSPDGKRIAFDSNQRGDYDIYVADADGRHLKRLTNEFTNFAPVFTADDKHLLYSSNRTGRGEVWTYDLESGASSQLTHTGGQGPMPSSDGKFVFYVSGQGAVSMLMRIPAAGGEPQKLVDGIWRYSFAPSTRGVYYLVAQNKLSLRFLDFATGKSKELLAVDQAPDLGLSLSPDGRRLLFSKVDRQENDLMLVEGFR